MFVEMKILFFIIGDYMLVVIDHLLKVCSKLHG